MQSALEEAVDGLYAVFASWKRPRTIDYCGHCVGRHAVERLLAPQPLREIPVETLRFYTVDVLVTAGSPADFRYFLPRILHIAVTDGFDWPDLDLVMSKFVLAEWRGWPASEQQAVTAFLHALWSTTVSRFPAEPDAAEVLEAIGRAEDDLTPYLRTWEAALVSHAGANHLLEYVRWNDAWDGLAATVAATAETVTDEAIYDVLLEILVLL